MKIKNEEYAQRFLPLPNGHTLPKCKVIKTFLNWLNEIAVVDLEKKYWLIVVVIAFIARFIVSNIDFSGLSELYTQSDISFMKRTSIYLDTFEEAEDTLNIFSVIINFLAVLVVVYLLDESNIKHWFSKIYIFGWCVDCLLSFWPFVHRAEVALTIFFIIVFTWIFHKKCKLFLNVMRYSIIIFFLLTYLKRNIVYDKNGVDKMHPYSITNFD